MDKCHTCIYIYIYRASKTTDTVAPGLLNRQVVSGICLITEMENIFVIQGIFVALFIVSLIWYFRLLIKEQRNNKLGSQFSGTQLSLLTGYIKGRLITPSEVYEAIMKSTSKFKSPQRLWFGPGLVIHLFEPEDIKIVLNSPYALEKHSGIYSVVEMLSGRGLITTQVEEWKRHRKLMNSCFNRKSIDGFFDTFCIHSGRLSQGIGTNVDKGIFNAYRFLIQYVMGSTIEAMLGFTVDQGNLEDIEKINKFVKTLTIASGLRATRAWYYFDTTFKVSFIGRKVQKIKENFNIYIDSLVKRFKEDSIQKMTSNDETREESEPPIPRSIVRRLISMSDEKGQLTPEELRGEINTLLTVGVDVTTGLIGSVLILLGMHPEVQENVHNEIKAALGSRQRPEIQDLKNLEYLDRVMKEASRIIPAGVAPARYTQKDIQLTNHIIPSNTTVLIGIASVHKDPSIWANPNKFDPDRFLPEEEQKRHRYSFIPFSAGPRNCIGIQFAWMSVKVALCYLIREYKLTTDYKNVEDVRLITTITCRVVDGYKISVMPR